MLQITLEPQSHINSNPSHVNNDWDFKLKVVREGDYTELRISFENSQSSEPEEGYTTGEGNIEDQSTTLI